MIHAGYIILIFLLLSFIAVLLAYIQDNRRK